MSKPEVIFVCEECNHIFTEEDKQVSDESKEWGHPCMSKPKSKKHYQCESYLKRFIEDKSVTSTTPLEPK